MRHRKKIAKLSRSRSQRAALVRSLLRAVVINESIKTTERKAKAVRPKVDRLVQLAKDNTLHSRRLAYRVLNDHKLVQKLFERIGPRFTGVQGGYSRIFDIGIRKGDGAKISLLELTRKEEKLKQKKASRSKVVSSAPEKGEHPDPAVETQKKGFMKGVKTIFKKDKSPGQ